MQFFFIIMTSIDSMNAASFMDDIERCAIKIKNYMCFGDNPQGLDSIKPINIIIGRNNSGKSRLLDLIAFSIAPKNLKDQSSGGKPSGILMTLPLTESEIKRVFPENTSGGIIGGNFWDFGKKFVGKMITISISEESQRRFISTDPPLGLKSGNEFEDPLAKVVRNPFAAKKFRKIQAERDIKPDASSVGREVNEDGNGATNNVDLFINDKNYSRDLVTQTLLEDLNSIVEPDMHFEDVTVRRDSQNNTWEIFLKEKGKGLIPLSRSGSGLKTILLVLINILLIPEKEKIGLYNYFFAFEELENNLHPAIQRRLFAYIRTVALNKKAHFIITTHSNIVIDQFSRDPLAQIYHVLHNQNESKVIPVKTYVEACGVLDDLDIRASDLLQSNGLIWVEGPSDRIYLTKFIELWSEGEIHEGTHYQCVFYGGRLLAHLSSEMPGTDIDNLIKILLTNRNAMMLIDSDKKSEDDDINDTKKRMLKEITSAGGICWITKGKTIENYIPSNAISSLFKIEEKTEVGQYEYFGNCLDTIEMGEGTRFLRNKVLFAERIRPYLKKEDLIKSLDLDERLDEVVQEIKKWNKY